MGGFLGVNSPDLLTTRRPIDMLYYDDRADFLEMVEKNFGFHFAETRKALLSDITDEMIQKAIDKAKQMKALKRAEDKQSAN